MACVELGHLKQMLGALLTADFTQNKPVLKHKLKDLIIDASDLQQSICRSLEAIVLAAGKASAALPYEVDGYGAEYHMDDANVPSLLSLPLLGFLPVTNAVYQATRAFALSPRNPFFFSGSAGEGVGSPHGRGYNYTWPIGIIVRAMTSQSDDEIKTCLDTVRSNELLIINTIFICNN